MGIRWVGFSVCLQKIFWLAVLLCDVHKCVMELLPSSIRSEPAALGRSPGVGGKWGRERRQPIRRRIPQIEGHRGTKHHSPPALMNYLGAWRIFRWSTFCWCCRLTGGKTTQTPRNDEAFVLWLHPQRQSAFESIFATAPTVIDLTISCVKSKHLESLPISFHVI